LAQVISATHRVKTKLDLFTDVDNIIPEEYFPPFGIRKD